MRLPGFAVARGISLAVTIAGCSVSFSYGYVLITLLFFILNNVKYTKNEMAIKCRFHSTPQLSFATYCAPTNTQKVILGLWAGTQAGLFVKWLLQSPAYLKENGNSSTIFQYSPVPNFMKICSAALTLLCVYTWTDEAILHGPPMHLKINSNIHPGSSYQATCRKCCSHNWVDVQCFAQTQCYNVTKKT